MPDETLTARERAEELAATHAHTPTQRRGLAAAFDRKAILEAMARAIDPEAFADLEPDAGELRAGLHEVRQIMATGWAEAALAALSIALAAQGVKVLAGEATEVMLDSAFYEIIGENGEDSWKAMHSAAACLLSGPTLP